MAAGKTDILIIGGGLAGLVAACEAIEAGRRVMLVEQEGEQSLGGQAFWSFGGLFLVDSPEQRRMGIKDSRDLAWSDWQATARFDREEDHWPRRWAEAYVNFAAGEKRSWLRERGMRWFPVVGWAERGGHQAQSHGNTVPRFHVTWGTGEGIVEPFVVRVLAAAKAGKITLKFRHRVTSLMTANGTVTGAAGDVLEASSVPRGAASPQARTGGFEIQAESVIVTSGGIGGNLDLVRANWPKHLGTAPKRMIAGVPQHVDGRMLGIAQAAGATLINGDRMWHYTEGIKNFAPIWPSHGIRILPGPSSYWIDATGRRLPPPFFPGFDTLGTLKHILSTGYEYSWFVTSEKIVAKEFALSGSEQNPDLTNKSWRQVIQRATKGMPDPVRAFLNKGEDFIVDRDIGKLVARMNALVGGSPLIDARQLEMDIRARDMQLDNAFGKDAQITAIRGARAYRGDRLIRTATPHKILDPANGPLVAVRLNIVTRKTLGGLQSDLDGRVIGRDGSAIPGLYAAGEVAGFGGGGVHGYASLEGTFLGGCIFSGRSAGRAAGKAVS